eukprot:gene14737-biopygen6604
MLTHFPSDVVLLGSEAQPGSAITSVWSALHCAALHRTALRCTACCPDCAIPPTSVRSRMPGLCNRTNVSPVWIAVLGRNCVITPTSVRSVSLCRAQIV